MSIICDNAKYYIDGGYAINHVKNGRPIEKHPPDFIEFSYTYRGKCIHTIDGMDYPASHGDLVFINYNSEHTIKSEGDFEYADVLIKPEFIDESLKGNENAFSLLALSDFTGFEQAVEKDKIIVHFSSEERKQIETLIAWLEDEGSSIETGGNLILKSCMNIFLITVFRKMALPMNNSFGVNGELLEFIKKNCTFHLQMDQIAEKCNYNPSYFSRLFKKYTGCTFTEYLNDARLEYAAKFIDDTEMNVDDIILRSGFSDRSKFFKDFVDKYGVTPKKFRKK